MHCKHVGLYHNNHIYIFMTLYSSVIIRIAYLKIYGIDQFGIGIQVCYKKLYPQIILPFNFLIQKYFFHDNPTWNINYSE